MSVNYLNLTIVDQHGKPLWINKVVAIAGNLEIMVQLPERDAELHVHPTGLNATQKEEVRQMIQSALDTGSA